MRSFKGLFRSNRQSQASGVRSAEDESGSRSTNSSNVLGLATSVIRQSIVTEADVYHRTWRLERENGDIVAKHLRLLLDGRMSGFRYENEYRWVFEDGCIVFLNESGERATIFSTINQDPFDHRYVLEGDFLLPWPCPIKHVLREVEFMGVRPPPNGETVGLFGSPDRKRANLVVLRANEKSLHNEWYRDVTERDRNWDLCVSWYGDEANIPSPDAQEYVVNQPLFRKFSAIHQLFFDGSPLWDYEYMMFPDDDLVLTWRDLNRSFELTREYGLELAQPSLREGSYWGLEMMLQQANTLLRYTSFVESMMPIFRKDALETCISTFPQSLIGWGLDALWPTLLGSKRNNVGVFDAIGVLHTRPIGATYNGTEADKSGAALLKSYGVEMRVNEYGRIRL